MADTTPDRTGFDPAELGPRVYPLLNSVIVPRPIAWVASVSAAGVPNLAPHSYFTVSSVQPPVVQFTSVGIKDSLRNVRETGMFVVHIVSRGLAEAANVCATDFPAAISEYDHAGLTTAPGKRVAVPSLVESPVAIECRSAGERLFGDSVVVFGEVVWIEVAASVLAADGAADLRALDPVSRLGRDEWGAVGELFDLRRVPYAEWAGR